MIIRTNTTFVLGSIPGEDIGRVLQLLARSGFDQLDVKIDEHAGGFKIAARAPQDGFAAEDLVEALGLVADLEQTTIDDWLAPHQKRYQDGRKKAAWDDALQGRAV